ncbi:hypothetical protein BU24DRAFT_141896 [Aaosphaeria arxii CBS 175.79]|uniref:Uncharacterized protein n=1 Tax=Aaosphaeria arxii CBS 175.79 TaxID=1450172 RepID=A0A6A5XWI6_9PLEO|nr:uncharacterized protein BU24DRAFT_141896 [Aaosphaeria arxii CBS 175.79]KAF2017000.1 hypothetical protein BU24DRAFT_141896 [Aaosphaeria arxii CBS 175.79]
MASDRRPLISESSDLSDTTANNTPALPSLGFGRHSHSIGFELPPYVSPPTSPRRPGYSRIASDTTAVDRGTPSIVHEEDEGDIADSYVQVRRGTTGLGIANESTQSSAVNSRRVSVHSLSRVPVGSRRASINPITSRTPDTLSPPNTGDPLFGGFPRDSPETTPDLRRERFSPRDTPGGSYEEFRTSRSSLHARGLSGGNEDYQQYLHDQDTDRLNPGAPSIRSAYDKNFRPREECPTAKDFYMSRFSWISVCIIVICLFSTIFSGIFLGIALKKPRWGRTITSKGSFKPADAILLTSIMAKLIELSFVTSFVAFLGQVLSRRAFMKEQGRGVTLSELSMWRWVVQPGTLITHWETMKYSGLSVLGILSLLSAVLATLYTPAATALVQPALSSGKLEFRTLKGRYRADFANSKYISNTCPTPIRSDPDHGGSTCLQIEHAGQGYHNYQRYLAHWDWDVRNGNGSTEQDKRPPGFGLLYENTTVWGQWINIIDTKEESRKHKRAINNISLAMPHAGVFAAARDQRNDILQPDELNSEGVYSLRASVPSLVMNVLCANMEADELKPIIYEEWNTGEIINTTTWQRGNVMDNATTINTTKVDDIFGWTKKDKKGMTDYPPVFPKLPQPFNTVLNHTSLAWGREAIYLLGQGGADYGSNHEGEYVLCKMHVSVTPHCSTRYNATGSGGSMEALCEDPDDKLAYIRSNSSATNGVPVPDWRDVGFDWANSMSLGTGLMNGDASNSRLLTQLILSKDDKGDYDLSSGLPSVGEALAVMSGCTVLKSTLDARLSDGWKFPRAMLEEYQTQEFNASLVAQQYASGGNGDASRAWNIILLLVFLMNIFVLIYFLVHRGLVTDFSEPPNLFALAVNSPPSQLLAGSCGGGPEGKQYLVNWFVNTEGDHLYMEPGEKPVVGAAYVPHGHRHAHSHLHMHPPAQTSDKVGFFASITDKINKLRQEGLHIGPRKQQQPLMRPASVVVEPNYEMEDGHTRTQRNYAKLAKRTSML